MSSHLTGDENIQREISNMLFAPIFY